MSHPIFIIAKDEYRYWLRTKLALSVLIIGLVLTLLAVVVNSMQLHASAHQRSHQQQQAEARFAEQPDRHPHRMVHYGHYLFRNPTPLSTIDPGIDAFTGTAIFLEGHRQNSAAFSAQKQSSGLNRFSRLTPSFLVQVLVPLFIIVIGYASVAREKESGALHLLLSQGLSPIHLALGKGLALMSVNLLFLLPLIIAVIAAAVKGEDVVVSALFIAGYFLYLVLWSAMVITASIVAKKTNVAFASLVVVWVLITILLPRIGSSTAATLYPSAGKLETDFVVLEEMRKLGDGHNASDPAFAKLKANLLAKYDVETVEELPVNFRGVVAQHSEQQLTDVLKRFAELRMQNEQNQTHIARQFGWLSPTVAIRALSMQLAGTSIETHHRFLREAEAVRFEFVQGLNKLHENTLNYQDDINRNKSKAHGQKARIDASNWQLLNAFSFAPDSASARLAQALAPLLQLMLWLVACLALMSISARRKLV